MQTRVVLIDPNNVTRECWTQVVKAAGDSFKLVESFSAVFQASKLICELGVVADIVVIHEQTIVMSQVLRLLDAYQKAQPNLINIVLSTRRDQTYVKKVAHLNNTSYILINAEVEQYFLYALQLASTGAMIFSPELIKEQFKLNLSEMELQVLDKMSQDMLNQEIIQQLNISMGTLYRLRSQIK
jgi:DNA-binding NarL/FixJ family response regulator